MNRIYEQRLVFLENEYSKRVGKTHSTVVYSRYGCICGNTCIKRKSDVTRGRIQSCGRCNGHRQSKTRFYRIWAAMKTRCNNKNIGQYYLWGGKGVKVCHKWSSYLGFVDDMYDSYKLHVAEYGEKDTTLDRIRPDGHYELDNCRWATVLEQANNQTRIKRFSFGGEQKTIPEISQITGIPAPTLYERHYMGRELI